MKHFAKQQYIEDLDSKKEQKMKNIIKGNKNTEQNKSDAPIEKCVVCGAETPYIFSTPISQRKYYVEYSGQLCQGCYYNIYIKK